MGRPRIRKSDEKLPPYVRRQPSRDRVIYQPYHKGQWGKATTLKGDDGKRLPANAPASLIHRAFGRLEPEKATRTLDWLIDQHRQRPKYKRLAPKTRHEYEAAYKRLCDTVGRGGARFGETPIRVLQRAHFIRWHELRTEQSGEVAANRDLAAVRPAFTYAVKMEWLKASPAHDFELNAERARERYITDAEYDAMLAKAKGRVPHLWISMELSYLCRARIDEVLSLRLDNLSEDGVHLIRAKGSDSEITLWSDRLRAAVDAALGYNSDAESPYLLHDSEGEPITYRAVDQAYRRVKAACKVTGCTFHDIKAKGITDHKDHHGGHRDERMRSVYVRRPDAIEPTR